MVSVSTATTARGPARPAGRARCRLIDIVSRPIHRPGVCRTWRDSNAAALGQGLRRPPAADLTRPVATDGAQERTRTSTALRPLAPEASASTNSATWARGQRACRALRRMPSTGLAGRVAALAPARAFEPRRSYSPDADRAEGRRHAQPTDHGVRRHGFIGRHLVRRLAARRRAVRVVSRDPARARTCSRWAWSARSSVGRRSPRARRRWPRRSPAPTRVGQPDRHPARDPAAELRGGAGGAAGPDRRGAAARRRASAWCRSRRSAPIPIRQRLRPQQGGRRAGACARHSRAR